MNLFNSAYDIFYEVMTSWANWLFFGLAIFGYLVFLLCYWIYLFSQWKTNLKRAKYDAREELLKTKINPDGETQQAITMIIDTIGEMINNNDAENILFIDSNIKKDAILSHCWQFYDQDKNYNSSYVDCQKIEQNRHHDYGSLLIGRLVSLANYKVYMNKKMRMKVINIFASKLPFTPASDISNLEVQKKTIIFLDNIDVCKADNIKDTLEIIKNSFLDISNLVIVCPINKHHMTKVLNHYYSYNLVLSEEELANNKVFDHYAKATNSKIIEI
ncbi:P-loop NTPase fold protein [Spiroplasma chrysopicola]|uniref:KAP NTPase domain-containing protein n=1 Tax=Spiroplasma chrysopicola DF-1 TaxID=1276227 RepID=R4UHN0_9MOLU|nr:P-loop NTPase fold protein [Spiroplasma chrysopicola]AGM24836.1 hypothetical protein SCHRY_v1c02510 [Spiroplasma chrysopicola DF-1]